MSLTPPATIAPRSAEPAQRTATAVLLKRLLWVARSLLGLLVLAWSLLLIGWLTLHWGILPHIHQWRGPIEARASKALGLPVRIGNIEVRSNESSERAETAANTRGKRNAGRCSASSS